MIQSQGVGTDNKKVGIAEGDRFARFPVDELGPEKSFLLSVSEKEAKKIGDEADKTDPSFFYAGRMLKAEDGRVVEGRGPVKAAQPDE